MMTISHLHDCIEKSFVISKLFIKQNVKEAYFYLNMFFCYIHVWFWKLYIYIDIMKLFIFEKIK